MDNFNTVLYTGNNGNLDVTGVGFDPDFVWAKNMDSGSYHPDLYDSVRGNNLRLNSSQTAAEATGFLTFETDGFSLTQGGGINANGNAHVAWNWLAGTAFSNDASATSVGTIDSTGQVNTKAGFSIISYTGNGSSSQTVAHGLSSTPEFLIHKDRDTNSNNNQWNIYHVGAGDDYGYFLTNAFTGAAQLIPTDTTTFELKANLATSNESGDRFIVYCFHSVDGYCKVGSYIGNGNANGSMAFTGFRPVFVLLKAVTGSNNWSMYDNKRDIDNPVRDYLIPNNAAGSAQTDTMDFLSNGFKVRNSGAYINTNGTKYIYLAFDDDGEAVNDPMTGKQGVTLGLKSLAVLTTKKSAASLLAPYDWYVTRKSEKSTAIPSAVSTYRDAVRTACASIETAIGNCDTHAKYKALYDQPVDSDGEPTGDPAPISAWPDAI